MFEVGFSEMLLIAVLALVVLGPERLPRVAAQMGRWVGRARAMARQFREQLEEEASLEATTRRPNAAGASSSDYSANTSAGSSSSTPAGGSSGEHAASTTGGASSDYASSPSAGSSSDYGSSTPGVSAGDYSSTPPSAGIDVSAASASLNEATPHTPPPEVAASTPAYEIDSNDTRHADLSQSPATDSHTIHDAAKVSAAAGEVHERGT
jgi:sec-independent protein translocase protein TatB